MEVAVDATLTPYEERVVDAILGLDNYATGEQIKRWCGERGFTIAMRRLSDGGYIRTIDRNEQLEALPWATGSFTHSTWAVTEKGRAARSDER